MISVIIKAESDTGRTRKENQDHFGYYIPKKNRIDKKGMLMTVADGMGGHTGGKTASDIAVKVLMSEYYKGPGGIIDSLENAVIQANHDVFTEGKKDELRGMGTTLTTVVLRSNEMYFAHVGDSRGYLIRDNEIQQFTEDHSYVQSLIKAGVITEDEAHTHPERNKITRAIGINEDVKVDLSKNPKILKDGDYLLLCSDGLHGVVPEDEILNTFMTFKDPDLICRKLIEMANDQGGPDNITTLIARIDRKPDFLDRIKNLFKLSKKPKPVELKDDTIEDITKTRRINDIKM